MSVFRPVAPVALSVSPSQIHKPGATQGKIYHCHYSSSTIIAIYGIRRFVSAGYGKIAQCNFITQGIYPHPREVSMNIASFFCGGKLIPRAGIIPARGSIITYSATFRGCCRRSRQFSRGRSCAARCSFFHCCGRSSVPQGSPIQRPIPCVRSHCCQD